MSTFDRNNPFQNLLFERRVIEKYLDDMIIATDFFRFAGSDNSVIYTKIEQKGQGDQIVFPLRQTFAPSIALGNEQLEGNEQELTYVSDNLQIGRVRFATKVTDEQLLEIQVKRDLTSEIRNDLISQASLFNTNRVLNSLAFAFDGGNAILPAINQQLAFSELTQRILNSRLDYNNGGVSRARVLIGDPNLVNGNSRTTYSTLASALLAANFPVATNTMNVSHIRQLANQAQTGKSLNISDSSFTVQESSVKPYQYKNHLGFQDKRYVLFIAPETYSKLVNDPSWQAQVSRGIIETQDQPSIIYGSMYKGTIEGIMVMVIPEFSNLIITNGAGNNYAYSVLCGASAIGWGQGNTPTFASRSSTDYGLHTGIAHIEISGMKVLKYPSKSKGIRGNNTNLVEYGLVHSFTTIS